MAQQLKTRLTITKIEWGKKNQAPRKQSIQLLDNDYTLYPPHLIPFMLISSLEGESYY